MALERYGRIGVRWMTRYRGGWTVYDQKRGLLAMNIPEAAARELVGLAPMVKEEAA